ncbi:MAG: hypothetical protein JWL66_1642 [Sphingomonadales bacterium]|nr:hypothetical protein [Sphingomonadales bacterium]
MHKFGLTAVLLLVVSLEVSAATPPTSQAHAERYIIDSEHQWAESVATNDASVVERILATDFVWVLDGEVLNKAQAVRFAKEGPGEFVSNHPDYVHVRFFGADTAVAQGSETWTKRNPSRKGRFVWTDTWIRRNGHWQIVAAEDDVVPIRG